MLLEEPMPTVKAVSELLHEQQDQISDDIRRNCAAVAQLSAFKLTSMSRVMQMEATNLLAEQTRVAHALEILEAGGDDAIDRALTLLDRPSGLVVGDPCHREVGMAQMH